MKQSSKVCLTSLPQESRHGDLSRPCVRDMGFWETKPFDQPFPGAFCKAFCLWLAAAACGEKWLSVAGSISSGDSGEHGGGQLLLLLPRVSSCVFRSERCVARGIDL